MLSHLRDSFIHIEYFHECACVSRERRFIVVNNKKEEDINKMEILILWHVEKFVDDKGKCVAGVRPIEKKLIKKTTENFTKPVTVTTFQNKKQNKIPQHHTIARD